MGEVSHSSLTVWKALGYKKDTIFMYFVQDRNCRDILWK